MSKQFIHQKVGLIIKSYYFHAVILTKAICVKIKKKPPCINSFSESAFPGKSTLCNKMGSRGCFQIPEYKRVRLWVEVPLAGKQIEPEEAVVTPTLANLEIGGEFSDDVLRRVARHLMQHLYAVLVPTQRTIYSKTFV